MLLNNITFAGRIILKSKNQLGVKKYEGSNLCSSGE